MPRAPLFAAIAVILFSHGSAIAQAHHVRRLRKINVGVASRRPTWCTPRPMWPKRSATSPSTASRPTSSSSTAAVAGTSVTAVGTGNGDLQPPRRRDRARAEGPPDLGPRAAAAAGLRGAGRRQDRRRSQGQAAVRRRRRRRLQLADGPRGAAPAGLKVEDAQFISRAPPAGCPALSPARSTASRCIPKTSISRRRRSRARMCWSCSPT